MSKSVRKILCCVAISPNSEEVILRALQEALGHDADVHILHVIPAYDASMATPIVSFMGEAKFNQLMEEHKEETIAEIQREIGEVKERIIAEHLDESIDKIGDILVCEGEPELEILRIAEELDADMIVMGTHTKKISQYTFMGSVATKVLKKASVPMLLVPPTAS